LAKFKRCKVCNKKATCYESSPDGPWFFCSRKHYEEYVKELKSKGYVWRTNLFNGKDGFVEGIPDYFLD
jgi:hypothetical protein